MAVTIGQGPILMQSQEKTAMSKQEVTGFSTLKEEIFMTDSSPSQPLSLSLTIRLDLLKKTGQEIELGGMTSITQPLKMFF